MLQEKNSDIEHKAGGLRLGLQKLWHVFRERFFPGRVARQRRRHLRIGRCGERIAEDYLRSRGYELLCRNFRFHKSELDLVMRSGTVICFVEVKTRRWKPGVVPAGAVDAHKEEMLYRGAAGYLREIGNPALPVRFDIMEVLMNGESPAAVHHLPGELLRFYEEPPEQ